MKRILMVEDNPVNRSLILAILRNQPYDITACESAEEGIARTANEQFDLILMDVGLPGMDGVEATRLLKSAAATQNIPIIILSAYAMHEEKQRASEAGCDAYLTKPLDLRHFRSVVEEFLSTPRQNLTTSENFKVSMEFQ